MGELSGVNDAGSDVLERVDRALAAVRDSREELFHLVQHMRATQDPRLNTCLRLAHQAGFTLDELGQTIGMTREGVRQRILAGPPQPRQRQELASEDLDRLRALHAQADGRAPARAQQTAAYRAFVMELLNRGVQIRTIARALCVTDHAVALQRDRAQRGAQGRWGAHREATR